MAKFFVNRPIVAMVISIVMVLVGVIVMRGLPIAQFPDIVPPMINVTTTYVGASAVDVEQSVATPLEQQVNGVENLIYMKSINANDGTLTLQVSFDIGPTSGGFSTDQEVMGRSGALIRGAERPHDRFAADHRHPAGGE